MYVYTHVYVYIMIIINSASINCMIVYTSRCVRVILAQGSCESSLHRSHVNG